MWVIQNRLGRQGANTDNCSISKVAKRFQMIGPFNQVDGSLGNSVVDQPVANGIQHRLMFAHRIDDGMWVFGPIKAKLF